MRKSWTEDEGRAAIEDWRRSGESLKAYCARVGVGESKLHYWRTRVNAMSAKKQTVSALVPVRVRRKEVSQTAGSRVEVVVRHGMAAVEIARAHDVDPIWVAAMARALATPA